MQTGIVQVDNLTLSVEKAILSLWDMYRLGKITGDEWLEATQKLLAQAYVMAAMLGQESHVLSRPMIDTVVKDVGIQLGFLKRFHVEVVSSRQFNNGWRARAQSYAKGIKVPYWQGKTRLLPLPAMPAQGTQCGSNCGCHWRIVTVTRRNIPIRYKCYWERGKQDSCQTCIQREKDWSPLIIDIIDGIPILRPSLGVTYKHLAGQHDQMTHAGNRGSSYDPAGIYDGRPSSIVVKDDYTKQRIVDVFGKEMSDEDLADIVGAPSGSEVFVTGHMLGVSVYVDHPLYDGTQVRTIKIGNDGKLEIKNESFSLRDDAPNGTGTSVFNRQVANARRLGVVRIVTYAGREDGINGYNGYYTWPRLGYDATIPYLVKRDMPESLKKERMLSDLMKTSEGRQWWKEHGVSMDMEFDLQSDSLSSQILDEYVKYKASR